MKNILRMNTIMQKPTSMRKKRKGSSKTYINRKKKSPKILQRKVNCSELFTLHFKNKATSIMFYKIDYLHHELLNLHPKLMWLLITCENILFLPHIYALIIFYNNFSNLFSLILFMSVINDNIFILCLIEKIFARFVWIQDKDSTSG